MILLLSIFNLIIIKIPLMDPCNRLKQTQCGLYDEVDIKCLPHPVVHTHLQFKCVLSHI